MRSSIRSLVVITAIALGVVTSAQTVVNVIGTVSPCVGLSYPVHIVSNSVPPIDTTVYTGAGCQYSFTFFPVETTGGVVVSTTCDGGVTWVSNSGNWNPFLATVILDLACNGGGSCNACFTVGSSQPWIAEFTNCTSGGSAPYAYEWTFPDGSNSNLANPSYSFGSSGDWTICLTITDANNCTSTTCDSVVVDADGNINPSFIPCAACIDAIPATNGPAGPPIPWTVDAINCSSGGVAPIEYAYFWNDGSTEPPPRIFSQPGVYQVCIIMTDAMGCESIACDSVVIDGDGTVDPVDPGDCTAGFWVMQAYEIDSLNPGTATPIPNLLWIWNLSSGGSGNYQFEWNWGDGTPNSTDPYPTHFYASGGPYYLCLTMTDSNGCTDTACDSISVDGDGFYTGLAPQENAERSGFTVNVLNQLPTGIDDRPVMEEATAWPNPVEDALNLRFYTSLNGNVPLTILDMNGKAVRVDNILINAGGNNTQVQVGDLAPGLYMLRFGNDARAVALRFVKR